MTDLIKTIKDRCHECYACVRNCPVKAVQVKKGQAEVISRRCIHCGNCVQLCSQGAKEVKDYLEDVKKILNSKQKVVAALAPSFSAFAPKLSELDWSSYLKEIGFSAIYEVAFGAQLIIPEYQKLLKKSDDLVISSVCPVIVNLISKYYPQLVANLAPIVSPMLALSHYIEKHEGADTKLVLIGPCLAKKGELAEINNSIVLTYSELFNLGKEFGMETLGTKTSKRKNTKKADLNKITPAARRLPLAGGLLTAVTAKNNLYPDGYLKVEGKERVLELLNCLQKGELKAKFIDILFCEGCINGVDLVQENYFKKEKAVEKHLENKLSLESEKLYKINIGDQIDFKTSFTEDYEQLVQPNEKEVWQILNQTNKFTEEDLLDCAACGYDSCRQKAIAVCQGLAEVEMCLPYLLSKKRSEVVEIQKLNRELDTLINSSYDGMMMINKQGIIERVNQAYFNNLDLETKLVGKKEIDLARKEIIYPALSPLVLREKRPITLVQNTKSGERILATASPVFAVDNKEVLRIVVNARNLKELNQLKGSSEEKLRKYIEKKTEDDNYHKTGNIIYKSDVLQDILNLAFKIAKTDSSVLITGESGVGKEVIARYVHEKSEERESLVKINCASIPENLLESELFGYETGAFSGAKREGKPGLIEKADGGTLFLDEIGEMPLNMQAKLLQVLQEHKLTRIGGIKPIDINFRLITATNQDLKTMVKEKKFREDLYYRLNVLPIYIPPLRERRKDILPLVNYFWQTLEKRYNKKVKLSSDIKQRLFAYDWPGNVRELNNLLERLFITAESGGVEANILDNYLDANSFKQGIVVKEILPLAEAVAKVEKELLIRAKEKGKTTYDMAKILGVNQSTIVRKLKKYSL